MTKRINLTGKVFGRWTVLGPKPTDNKLLWECQCICGTVKLVVGQSLRMGVSESCGCLHKEQMSKMFSTHKKSKTPIYNLWFGMLRRCTKTGRYANKYYAGRGIDVCDEWRIFENFDRDMGPSYRKGLTLERMDNDDGYFKENCKWATRLEQVQNRRPSSEWDIKDSPISTNTSGFRGAYRCQDNSGKWFSHIWVEGSCYYLGTFNTKEEAGAAYKSAAKLLRGVNAKSQPIRRKLPKS